VWEKPVSAAIERIDQCVASVGIVHSGFAGGGQIGCDYQAGA
jgi:hypothetical protein